MIVLKTYTYTSNWKLPTLTAHFRSFVLCQVYRVTTSSRIVATSADIAGSGRSTSCSLLMDSSSRSNDQMVQAMRTSAANHATPSMSSTSLTRTVVSTHRLWTVWQYTRQNRSIMVCPATTVSGPLAGRLRDPW